MKEQAKDRVPPVTDDVDVEIIPSQTPAGLSDPKRCESCGEPYPEKRLVGRCVRCGKLFMLDASLS